MTRQTAGREAVRYTPPLEKQAQIAEAIACILAGRPYPEHFAPTQLAGSTPPPATVEEGVRRILDGPSAGGGG